jgi:hypothetical protein
MTIVTLACVLTGMAVGLRFKVLMIVPVIVIAMISTGLIMAVRGDDLWAILGALAINAVGVQVGYLCGTFAQVMLRDARTHDPAMAPAARATTALKPRGIRMPVQYLD